MSKKPMHTYILNLLDFAQEIADLITPGNVENNNYFMTLIYIEDILDSYGRGFIINAGDVSLIETNRRLNALRDRIRELSQTYDFDEMLLRRSQTLIEPWLKK